MSTGKWWVRRNRFAADYTAPVAEAEAEPEPDQPTLDDYTKADLVAMAEARGLDTSGTKADLIDRLGSDDG